MKNENEFKDMVNAFDKLPEKELIRNQVEVLNKLEKLGVEANDVAILMITTTLLTLRQK